MIRLRHLIATGILLFAAIQERAIAESQLQTKSNIPPKVIMKIYFAPFRMVTEVPLTRKNLERHIHPLCFMKEHPLKLKLRNILESRRTNSKLDENNIRLKVEFVQQGDIFYVDSDGIVVKNDSTYFELTQEQRDEVEKDVLYFSGVVDAHASQKTGKEPC